MSVRKFIVHGVDDYDWGAPKAEESAERSNMTVWAEDVGDDYHTMHDLYQHRMALTLALFHAWNNAYNADVDLGCKVGKAKLHHDGTMFEGGYFVVFAETSAGQITYHYKLKHWDEFNIPEWDQVPFPYDGHTALDVLERLAKA